MPLTSRIYDKFSAQGTTGSRIALQRSRERGCTGLSKIWTEEEENTLRKIYPNRQLMILQISSRSRFSCVKKAGKLGLSTKRNPYWTSQELQTLRKLYGKIELKALQSMLSPRSPRSIETKAFKNGISSRKRRKMLLATPQKSLNSLRDKCFELNITMAELDGICGFARYFASGGARRKALHKVRHAIGALGGQLHPNGHIAWSD